MARSIRLSSFVVSAPSVVALLLACGQAHAQLTGPSTPIALSGSTNTGIYGPNLIDPNTSLPEYFTIFGSNPTIGRSGGEVVFGGDTNIVTGELNTGQGGLWIWSGSNTNLVKYTDNPALGGVGTYSTSGVASQIITNGSGQYAFRDGSGATGTLYTNSGTPGRLLKAGDTAPGTGGATFSQPGNIMAMNGLGSIATFAQLTTGTGSPAVVISGTTPYPNYAGFWAGTPGALTLQARMGDQLAATGNVALPNVLIGTLDTAAYSYTDSGALFFSGALAGSAVNTSGGTTTGNNQALMSTRSGYEEIVARRGDVFPDGTGSTSWTGSAASTDAVAYKTLNTGNAADMNNAGHVVFSGSLRTSAGATPTTNGTTALFSDNTGTLRTIARETSSLPAMSNLGAGLKWGSTYSAAVINGANTVAFTAGGLTGTDPNTNVAVTSAANSGLFKMDSTGTFTKVMRSGDSAPAWPAVSGNPALGQSVPGANPVFSGTPSNFIMNSSGQMAFVETLTGVGIVTGQVGNQSGLFAVDTDGSIYLVAQKGMLFHVGPGDDRIVSGVSGGLGGPNITTGNQDGRASSLDDNGNLVFSLQFTDPASGPGSSSASSGVFVFHIPAPSSAALLGLGGLAMARRRRR